MTAQPDKFRIAHNGMEWHGSFQDALTAALDGLLDGGPVVITVTFDVDDHRSEPITVDARITHYDDEMLYSEDGQIYRRESVLAIEVS